MATPECNRLPPRQREIPNEPDCAGQPKGTKVDVAVETSRNDPGSAPATAGCPSGQFPRALRNSCPDWRRQDSAGLNRQIRLQVAPPASAVIRLLNLRDEEGWVRGGILGCCLRPSFGF